MTESVRRNFFGDAGGFGIFFDNALDGAGSEAAIIARSIDSV